MPFQPPDAPGYSFSDGKLRIFGEDLIMVITGWPEPMAVRRTPKRPSWRNFMPDFRLVRPYRRAGRNPRGEAAGKRGRSGPAGQQMAFAFHDLTISERPQSRLPLPVQRKKALDGFRFSLPRPVAACLEPFQSHQWPLLLLLRHDEDALDLAKQNPALAFLLAQKMNGDVGMIRSLQCGGMRQRDLLDTLHLPASPSAVKLFRKLKPASINGDNWQVVVETIRRELEQPKSRLVHLPAINSGVLEILNHPVASRAASQGLLAEVAGDSSENYRARIVHLIANTLRMSAEMDPDSHHGLFRSVRRLREIHDEVSATYTRRLKRLHYAQKFASTRFALPPIPGILRKIEPLTSPEELVHEGEVQGNCVASYASRVEQGEIFIYRVLEPERATLSVVRTPGGLWKIGELERKYNTPVSPETEDFVEAWIERHRISP